MLGKTFKLGNVQCFGLPAGPTCAGSVINGEVLPVCKACYAKCGTYNFKNVKDSRFRNFTASMEDTFVEKMVNSIKGKYFRWFDSGDIYDMEFAEKVYQIAKQTPETKHWIPSKTLALPQYKKILNKLNKLPNVNVRLSYGHFNNKFGAKYGAIVVRDVNAVPKGVHVCDATKNHGSCGSCKACWDKKVKVIAYVVHGQFKNRG